MQIALIAHDERKAALIDFANTHEESLADHELVATGATAERLTEETALEVEPLASGPDGGDLQIGSRIVTGDCEAVLFFRDPMTAQPHEPDVTALLRICDVHGIPLATNEASATALVEGLLD